MTANQINILVVGLLSTGSSALIDVLREYENIYVIPGEFNDFRSPGLVADQLDPKPHGIGNEIDKITKFKNRVRRLYSVFPFLKPNRNIFKGIISRYKYEVLRYKQLNLLRQLNSKNKSEKSTEKKIQNANEWIRKVGNTGRNGQQFAVFNQALLPSIETKTWKQVFNPCKLIIVYRDPKDQLAEIIRKGNLYTPFGGANLNLGGVTLETIYGRNREGAIKMHIDAIKKRFKWIDSLKKELNGDEFLLVDFEGLTNKYERYKTIIEHFLGDIKPDKKLSKLYFDPLIAHKNVGIYKNYLSKNEETLLNELSNWYSDSITSNLHFKSV